MDTEAMQDSGVEWIGAIQQGWRVKRLKYLTVSIKDGTHGSFERIAEGIPLLSAKNIKNGEIFISNDESTISEDDYRAINANGNLKHGDLLLTIVGSIGRVAIYNSKLKAAFQRSVAMLRVSYELENKYLFHLVQSDFFQNQLNSNTKKNIQGGIYLNDLSKLHVIYPPLSEQQAITQYLDQRCGKLDAIIAIKQQQIKTLDALRQSIIYHAVTKSLDDSLPLLDSGVEWLGDIPQGWKQYRIKDVAELSPNYSGNKPEPDELCTVIPMESVSVKGNIDISNLELYENITNGLTFFENGDVIFAKITPCMENGKGAYVTNIPTRYAFGSTEFHVLRSGYKLNGKFLYYYTYNSAFRDYAAVNMTGAAGQKRVSTNFLKYTIIYLPDIGEQQRIADHLDYETQRLNNLKVNLSQQISTLQAYKKALIYECVTGKKRIKADTLKAG